MALASRSPIVLLSARGAALAGGCLWWRAMIDAALAETPNPTVLDVLDCADAAGRAMAALRAGQRTLVLSPASPAFPAVRAAADTMGATVWVTRPPALDLGARGAARLLSTWLADDTGRGVG